MKGEVGSTRPRQTVYRVSTTRHGAHAPPRPSTTRRPNDFFSTCIPSRTKLKLVPKSCVVVKAGSTFGGEDNGQSLRGALEEEENERFDKLAEVFARRDEDTWVRLMAQSRRWEGMRDGFFARLEARARTEREEEKGNPDAKMKGIGDQDQKDLLQDLDGKDESLVGLVARLRDASSAYDGKKRAFDKLVDCNEVDLEGLVALLGPNNLDGSFFEFCRDVVASHREDREEQERLAGRMAAVIALREAQADLESDAEGLQKASEQLGEILESPSLEEAEKKIDLLLADGAMDPAMMMVMAKAWAGAKESTMMKEEAKDVMFHLYNKARDGLTTQQPTEFKILKHVVSQPTDRERRDVLEAAFTPGLNYEDADVEYLSTTPERLLETVETVLTTYELQRMKFGSGALEEPAKALRTREGDLTGSEVFTGMMRESQAMPGRGGAPPAGGATGVIEDLRRIRVLIKRDFMVGQNPSDEGELWMS